MAERDLPEGTVTLVLTDIEGSTPAVHRLGRRYGESLELHRRIVREAATSRGGVEVDTQGDAFLLTLPRADDALDAATQGRPRRTGPDPLTCQRARARRVAAPMTRHDEGTDACGS